MLTERELEQIVNRILTKYSYQYDHATVTYNHKFTHTIAYSIGNCFPWRVGVSSVWHPWAISVSDKWFKANGPEFVVCILKHECAHFKYHHHGPDFKRECLNLGIKSAAVAHQNIEKCGWNYPYETYHGSCTLKKCLELI